VRLLRSGRGGPVPGRHAPAGRRAGQGHRDVMLRASGVAARARTQATGLTARRTHLPPAPHPAHRPHRLRPPRAGRRTGPRRSGSDVAATTSLPQRRGYQGAAARPRRAPPARCAPCAPRAPPAPGTRCSPRKSRTHVTLLSLPAARMCDRWDCQGGCGGRDVAGRAIGLRAGAARPVWYRSAGLGLTSIFRQGSQRPRPSLAG
jgi:hypothetical protein